MTHSRQVAKQGARFPRSGRKFHVSFAYQHPTLLISSLVAALRKRGGVASNCLKAMTWCLKHTERAARKITTLVPAQTLSVKTLPGLHHSLHVGVEWHCRRPESQRADGKRFLLHIAVSVAPKVILYRPMASNSSVRHPLRKPSARAASHRRDSSFCETRSHRCRPGRAQRDEDTLETHVMECVASICGGR